MIRGKRFTEFVKNFVRIRNKETEEKTLWEMWLHKVFDKSFKEFSDSVRKPESAEFEETKVKATVEDSFSMLDSFKPV